MELGESSKQLPDRWFAVSGRVSRESQSEPRVRGRRFWGRMDGVWVWVERRRFWRGGALFGRDCMVL